MEKTPLSFQGSIEKIQQKEIELINSNYCKSSQLDPKHLRPGEYIVTYFAGTEESFDGPVGGTLTWLEP